MKPTTCFYLILLFTLIPPKHARSQSIYIDREFSYQFETLKEGHNTRVLIDAYHPTIYRGSDHSKHDLGIIDILKQDNFNVAFLNEPLTTATLDNSTDILIIAGMQGRSFTPNIPGNGLSLTNNEINALLQWLYSGGSLLLIVGHFPNGQGAIPLMDRLGVHYRNGYAHYPGLYGEKAGGICSHFTMTHTNGLLTKHPIISRSPRNLKINTIHFLCGTAIFRNPSDAVLALPRGTFIYYADTATGSLRPRERGNSYAGMLAFNFGKGRVAVASDRGIFRHLIKTFNGSKYQVTMNNPENQNAALFVNTIRWLSRLN